MKKHAPVKAKQPKQPKQPNHLTPHESIMSTVAANSSSFSTQLSGTDSTVAANSSSFSTQLSGTDSSISSLSTGVSSSIGSLSTGVDSSISSSISSLSTGVSTQLAGTNSTVASNSSSFSTQLAGTNSTVDINRLYDKNNQIFASAGNFGGSSTFPVTVTGGLTDNTVKGVADYGSPLIQLGAFRYGGDTLFGASPDPDLIPAQNANALIIEQAGVTRSLTMLGGLGNDSIQVDTISQLISDSINGNAGTDTLSVMNAATFVDADFSDVINVEGFQLTGASQVTVDINAQAAGINTLFGGTGNTTFIQTAGFTNGLTMIGGAGNDSFQVANPTQLGNDKIAGNGGSDTLTIASNLLAPQGVADGAFANVSGIQTFIVNSSTDAVLGTNAQNAGISTVIGSSASDTIDASAFTNVIRIDETANTTVGDSLVGGSASDTFVVSGKTSLALSSINGNGGTDTLIVNTPATLSSGDLAGVTNVEALQLTGASSVLITDAITGTSISTVYGGQGNNLIDASNVTALGSALALMGDNLGADTLKGGALSDTLQGFSAASSNTNSDTLYGGASADTFVLGAIGSNGYGQTASGSPVASIADFNQGTDIIALFNHGAQAADYSVNNVSGNNWTITDNITGGLVANVGVASGAPLDLTTNVNWV